MSASPSCLRALPVLLLGSLLGLAACAPTNTNTTYRASDIGRTASLSYGTIVSMRPVTVQGRESGVGTLAGAGAGAVAGSFIGGGGREHLLGAIGGAVVGGLVGNAVEKSATTGQAMEFIIQEDNAPQPISVVQTNEDDFRPGQRVVLTRGDRTRLAHVAN